MPRGPRLGENTGLYIRLTKSYDRVCLPKVTVVNPATGYTKLGQGPPIKLSSCPQQQQPLLLPPLHSIIISTMSAETITTISPITGAPILTRQGVSEADFSALLSTSQKAFETFRHTHPLAARQEIVKKALGILASKADALGREITEQMGRPIAYTPKEVATAVKRGEYLLKVSNEVLADTPGEKEEGFRRWIRKEPLGPVLVVFAWNVGIFLFFFT
jgi:acyl-CoA reductase-like NAD-dependent aldehyde dehydrogenase